MSQLINNPFSMTQAARQWLRRFSRLFRFVSSLCLLRCCSAIKPLGLFSNFRSATMTLLESDAKFYIQYRL